MLEKEVDYRLAKWLLLNMEKDGVISSKEMQLALDKIAEYYVPPFLEVDDLNGTIGAYENAANYEPDLAPKFFSNRVCFIVTLWNLNFKASRDEALNEAINEALKPEALDLIALMKSDPTVTQAAMIQTLGLSRSKVQRVIKALTDDGYIKREGSKKTGRWVILKEV